MSTPNYKFQSRSKRCIYIVTPQSTKTSNRTPSVGRFELHTLIEDKMIPVSVVELSSLLWLVV